jgi:hypothetical protein
MHYALALLMVSVSVCAGEWDGIASDTAPVWYQAYLLLLSVGLPLYVFLGWLRRRLRLYRNLRELR